MFDLCVLAIILSTLLISFVRGFIKEFFSLLGIIACLAFTVYNYDLFVDSYSQYIKSILACKVFSVVSVFVLAFITIFVVNSWLMFMLSPIRLGSADRFAGLFIGAARGALLSFLLCFVIYTGYSMLSPQETTPKKGRKVKEVLLPHWFAQSHTYDIYQKAKQEGEFLVPEHLKDSATKMMKDMGRLFSEPKKEKPRAQLKEI